MSHIAEINDNRFERLHYADLDFLVFFRKNHIPAGSTLSDCSVHWHDEVEFIYVVSGSIGYFVNGTVLHLAQGHGLFVNSRQLHLILQEGQDCLLYCLIFHPSILCNSAVIAKAVSEIVTSDFPYLLLDRSNECDRSLLDLLASIDEVSNDINGQFEIMRAIFGIWQYLTRKVDMSHLSNPRAGSDLVIIRQMMLFAQEHCAEQLMLDDICRSGNVGKTKCSELFRKYLNTTPMCYLRNYRIEKSIHLMKSGMTVSEAARRVGFSELSHFSKVFKRRMKTGPREYMENYSSY